MSGIGRQQVWMVFKEFLSPSSFSFHFCELLIQAKGGGMQEAKEGMEYLLCARNYICIILFNFYLINAQNKDDY